MPEMTAPWTESFTKFMNEPFSMKAAWSTSKKLFRTTVVLPPPSAEMASAWLLLVL